MHWFSDLSFIWLHYWAAHFLNSYIDTLKFEPSMHYITGMCNVTLFSFYEWMYNKKQSKSTNPVGNKLNVGAPSQEFEPKKSKKTHHSSRDRKIFMFLPQVTFHA